MCLRIRRSLLLDALLGGGFKSKKISKLKIFKKQQLEP
ncbi:hypothetical protein HPSA20_1260 [Helicobacter pylori SouthAfrica20]|uniref:Uncharacterized protein n=1 Tax=Helicobacter pylori SouthAfrica20 TaxID=1352356 RepID=T1UB24_HELPX|nr:hypothetical protein HPSA20_1260 [Helicobacter pylori SouthAfrica20]